MRSCSKERTNIPITISVLHDQEYQLYRMLHRSGRRRAFTERHVELDRKTTTARSKGPQVASTQMIRQEADA
jgi:hypothetical protein